MADPVTMGAVSIGSSILGGVFGASGAKQQASASAGQYGYQAALGLLNSQINKQNAQYARDQGERRALQYGLGARQRQGEIVAAQSASGLDVRSGSQKEVQESQHTVSLMDMDQIRTDAAKTAYNFEIEAFKDILGAKMKAKAGMDAESAGNVGVLSSIIGAAGSVADKWYRGRSSGMWGG